MFLIGKFLKKVGGQETAVKTTKKKKKYYVKITATLFEDVLHK